MKLRKKYLQQRRQAIVRGIEWQFTFEEWVGWWNKQLGPDWIWMRGRHKNQYVMARYYDDGPYAAHNVKCITASANVKEVRTNPRRISRLRLWTKCGRIYMNKLPRQ